MAATAEADGVFQGGGIRGLALAGALMRFADHERFAVRRWVNVAGTSAGAMIAALVATDHGAADLERMLHELPYEEFKDYGRGGPLASGAWNFAKHHGLAHGEVMREWLDEQLGGATFGDVRREESVLDKGEDPYRLRLIASDLTQRRMLVLPADLAGYRVPGTDRPIDPDTFRIADAVRMSMSIPFVYQPVLLESLGGELCTIVDGSILSNFPVWLFDVDRDARRPTFGFRLVGGTTVGDPLRRRLDSLGWPVQFGIDMFHTITEAWDTRFMSHSTVVRTCQIPTGDASPIDFAMSAQERRALVDAGSHAAKAFLDDFQAEQYVNTFGRRLASAPAE